MSETSILAQVVMLDIKRCWHVAVKFTGQSHLPFLRLSCAGHLTVGTRYLVTEDCIPCLLLAEYMTPCPRSSNHLLMQPTVPDEIDHDHHYCFLVMLVVSPIVWISI